MDPCRILSMAVTLFGSGHRTYNTDSMNTSIQSKGARIESLILFVQKILHKISFFFACTLTYKLQRRRVSASELPVKCVHVQRIFLYSFSRLLYYRSHSIGSSHPHCQIRSMDTCCRSLLAVEVFRNPQKSLVHVCVFKKWYCMYEWWVWLVWICVVLCIHGHTV